MVYSAAESANTKSSSVGGAMSNTMREAAPAAERALENMSYGVGKQAGEILSVVSDRATEYYDNSRRFVKDNPGKGVAIAASVGFATGCLLTWAMRRRG